MINRNNVGKSLLKIGAKLAVKNNSIFKIKVEADIDKHIIAADEFINILQQLFQITFNGYFQNDNSYNGTTDVYRSN